MATQGGIQAGRALHYLQDNVIVSPKVDKSVHDEMERACRRLDPAVCALEMESRELVGKKETYKEIESVKAVDVPSQAMRRGPRTLVRSISFHLLPVQGTTEV